MSSSLNAEFRAPLHWRPAGCGAPPGRREGTELPVPEEEVPHDVQAPERADARASAGSQAGAGGGGLGRRARQRRAPRSGGEGQRAARRGPSGIAEPRRPGPAGPRPPPGLSRRRAAAQGAAPALQPLPGGRAVRHARRFGGLQRPRHAASRPQRPFGHPLPERSRRVRWRRARRGRHLRRAQRPAPRRRHGCVSRIQPAPRDARDAGHATRVVLLDPEPRARRWPARADVGARRRHPGDRPGCARPPRAGPADGRLPQPPAAMGADLRPPLANIPPYVVAVADYEDLARDRMTGPAWAWLQGGAADETTLFANRNAFGRLELVPRVLADMAGANTRLELFGQSYEHPVFLAPVAFQQVAHPEGELATVQAASAMGAGMVVSTQASIPLEAIARAAGAPLWFQLYIQPDRDFTADLVPRADAAGGPALVVTAANLQGMRALPPQAARAGESPLLASELVARAPTWKDIAWLRSLTRLPILLKGILAPDDARRALDEGVAGLVVSNHGGRVLDTVPASI